ncbi:MAG: molybdenum cofactor biosynthesis protein [Acidobacteria bacterium]|nr:MAG: molybdenum cofactor biosynthesis protein [Acidobacteriota bacterium]
MTYNVVVITVSDGVHAGQRDDKSGPALVTALQAVKLHVLASAVVPDDEQAIIDVFQKYTEQEDVHLIVTTGGTGFGPRDVTPEATRHVIDRPAPGIAELLRQAGAQQTQLTWLSRAEAGIAGNKLIINLPGSPKAMEHSIRTLQPILFHALDLLNGAKPH